MNLLNLIEIISAAAGLGLLALLAAFPRFGPSSWMLALTLVPAFLAAGSLGVSGPLGWSISDSSLLSFAWLIFCGAGGCVASYSLQREDYLEALKRSRWFILIIAGAAPLLAAALYLMRPSNVLVDSGANLVALGPAGYAASVYLLLTSVIGLANLEQTLRGAEEYVRWEIKFLLLGIASLLAALIYVASQVLLYAPAYAFLPLQALRIFPIIFLCACLLIFQSWRRVSGNRRVVVSQGIVYSTITLLSVGLYLVLSSLLARIASQFAGGSISMEPVIFLISVMALAALLLGTAFRHRVRRFIRHNLFAGRYDYRQLWSDATEKVRSVDPPETSTASLAQLIHDSLGSLDISVWLGKPEAMSLIFARGVIDVLPKNAMDLSGALKGILEPTAVTQLDSDCLAQWPSDLLKLTRASLVTPLMSSGRLIGFITVGPDRSGRPFDEDAREFLRVLAVHAASEFDKSELLKSLVQAREAEAFEMFATFLAHDLKNFASTLSLIAKNAARFSGNPAFQADAFQSVFETAEKMKRLCISLGTFSKTLAANKTPGDVNLVVREVVEGFDASLTSRVHTDLAPLPLVEIDKQEVSSVLRNLILNANEASPDGLAILVSTRVDAKGIMLCVTDKGRGISKEFLEKELFRPFHTTKVDGLGIGLFQSKKIIEAHRGSIEVESREGEGTIIRVFLPTIEAGSDPSQLASPEIAIVDLNRVGEAEPQTYSKELTR